LAELPIAWRTRWCAGRRFSWKSWTYGYERLLLCRRLCRLITVFVDSPCIRRSRLALKFVALTDDYRRRSAFSVCFQCMTHAPVNQILAAQTSLSRSVVGQNVMCMYDRVVSLCELVVVHSIDCADNEQSRRKILSSTV